MRGNNSGKQLVLITVLTVILVFCVGALILLNMGAMNRSVPVYSSVVVSKNEKPSDSSKVTPKSSQEQISLPIFYDPPSSSESLASSESSVSSEVPASSCPSSVYYPPILKKPQSQPQPVIDVLTFNDIGEYEEYQIADNGYVYVGGVVIKNKTFNENLVITDKVGYDNVTLDNVVVNGNIFIVGGSTVTFHNVYALGVINENRITETDLILSGNTTVNQLTTKSTMSVDEYYLGTDYDGLENVVIEEGARIWQNFYLIDGKLDELYINDLTNVSVGGKAEIKNITAAKKAHLKGTGRVENFYIAADGVTFEFEPYYIYLDDNCLPPEKSKKSIGEF